MQTPIECTLLELLTYVNTSTADDQEATAIVVRLVNDGYVRLCGTFAGAKIALPSSLETFPKALWPILLGFRTQRPRPRKAKERSALAA